MNCARAHCDYIYFCYPLDLVHAEIILFSGVSMCTSCLLFQFVFRLRETSYLENYLVRASDIIIHRESANTNVQSHVLQYLVYKYTPTYLVIVIILIYIFYYILRTKKAK